MHVYLTPSDFLYVVPRTQKKLQAAVRGWLARRLARSLLLEGGCRREFDQASGAWQYVWSCRRSRYPNAHVTPGSDGRNQPRYYNTPMPGADAATPMSAYGLALFRGLVFAEL